MSNLISIQKNIHINASPETIFKVMADVENWHTWTPSITKITLLNNAGFEIGAKAKIVQPKLRPAVWEITELEQDRSFTWVAKSPGFKLTARHIIILEKQGCSVELVTAYEGILAKLIYHLTAALTERYMEMEISGLKEAGEKNHLAGN